ncbi:MAG: hypothetical protein OXE99_03150 [Cellvibrionales bacterium]|nr:hypothetical protein [Cellvibrionales bacterium]
MLDGCEKSSVTVNGIGFFAFTKFFIQQKPKVIIGEALKLSVAR